MPESHEAMGAQSHRAVTTVRVRVRVKVMVKDRVRVNVW